MTVGVDVQDDRYLTNTRDAREVVPYKKERNARFLSFSFINILQARP